MLDPKPCINNRLLLSLSADDLRLIQPSLQHVNLELKTVLVEPDKPITHVHFIEQGLASVMTASPRTERLEVSNIGWEGMTGLPVVFDLDRTPLQTFMQVAGTAWRMRASDLRKAIAKSPSLHSTLLRYAHTVQIQMSQNALALGRHTVNQRLARWILLYHDRTEGDDLPLTHEFLSYMLGVRRAGVTNALHVLEGEGMIKAVRSHVVVRDRQKLMEMAGDCYGIAEREYARVIEERKQTPTASKPRKAVAKAGPASSVDGEVRGK